MSWFLKSFEIYYFAHPIPTGHEGTGPSLGTDRQTGHSTSSSKGLRVSTTAMITLNFLDSKSFVFSYGVSAHVHKMKVELVLVLY